jgi:hypothetical protein
MPAYETTSFEPPAPVAQVTIRSPKTGDSVANVRMLIDTGADVTLVPRPPIVSLLDATEERQQYELVGFDGARSSADAVRLELHFLSRVFRGQFLLIDQDHGILGRNVLNAIPLLLDGPKLNWEEYR